MKLSVLERLLLLQLLPAEGSLTTLKIVRELREELSFDAEEHARLNFVQDDGRITWNLGADVGKELDFNAKAQSLMVERLEWLDGEGKVREEHLSLFEKFGLGM